MIHSLLIPNSNGLSFKNCLIWTCKLHCQLIWLVAEVTGVNCTRQTMLTITISGAPDRIVSWSVLSRLLKTVNQNLLLNFFKLLKDIVM